MVEIFLSDRITQTDPKMIRNSRKNVFVVLIPETDCAPAPDLMAEMIEEDIMIVLGPLAEMIDITGEVIVVAGAIVEEEIAVVVIEGAEVIAETDMIVVIIMATEIMIVEMIIDIEIKIDTEKENETSTEIEITIEEEVIVAKEQEAADLEVGTEEIETFLLVGHNTEVFK